MAIYDEFTVETTRLGRRKVIGPFGRSQEILAAMHEDGWKGVRIGPYTDSKMFPNVDDKRFLFVMDREIDD